MENARFAEVIGTEQLHSLALAVELYEGESGSLDHQRGRLRMRRDAPFHFIIVA